MATKHKNPIGLYGDVDENRRPLRWRENLPQEERMVRLLRAAQRACQEVLDLHDHAMPDGGRCDCHLCRDVSGWAYLLSMHSIVESEMHPFEDEEDACPCCGTEYADEDDEDEEEEPTDPPAPAAPGWRMFGVMFGWLKK